jgi:hypothetical protein
MTTVLQKIIQWSIGNAKEIKTESGTIISIDYEEMKKHFDVWLQEETEQIRDYTVRGNRIISK